jgi:hypothetical protein
VAITTEAPPTTDVAITTEAPPTTDAMTTENAPASGPVLRVVPGAIATSASVFAEQWNANTAGTNVPALTDSEVTALEDGPTATTFIAPLSDHVGLVGVVRNDDQSVAKALLVWIPGGDHDESNQLYRDAFDVLLRTVNPNLTPDARARVASGLGLSALAPPFAAGETATAEEYPDRFTRYVRATSVSDDTSVVSVVDARG